MAFLELRLLVGFATIPDVFPLTTLLRVDVLRVVDLGLLLLQLDDFHDVLLWELLGDLRDDVLLRGLLVDLHDELLGELLFLVVALLVVVFLTMDLPVVVLPDVLLRGLLVDLHDEVLGELLFLVVALLVVVFLAVDLPVVVLPDEVLRALEVRFVVCLFRLGIYSFPPFNRCW